MPVITPTKSGQCTKRFELLFSTGAGIYRNVLGVLSSAVSAEVYRIIGKGQRSDGPMNGRSTLRDEVADAAELAADYSKSRYDEHTSTWKDEELLQPGKKVWSEMRGM